MGGPIILKKDVVPHIFDCHPQRSTAKSSMPRSAVEKLNRKRTITEILSESESNTDCERSENIENIPLQINSKKQSLTKVAEPCTINDEINITNTLSENAAKININTTPQRSSQCGTVLMAKVNASNEKENVEASNISHFINSITNDKKPIKKHFRSKAIQSRPITCNAESLAKPEVVDRQCSPIIMPVRSSSDSSKTITKSKSTTTATSTSQSEYQVSAEEMSELIENQEQEIKRAALRVTNYFISCDPKNYIGIPEKWL